MSFIVDKRILPEALNKLESLDAVVPFMTKGVTYPAIAGHPDIFFCEAGDRWVVSEAVPESIIQKLESSGVSMVFSEGIPGSVYPASAIFNAVVTGHFLIHRTDITDPAIKELCRDRIKIDVRQAYCRCNLLALDEGTMITSDMGIFGRLRSSGLDMIYCDPASILLSGFNHGFFGGCCGIFGQKVLVNGSLRHLQEGELIRKTIQTAGYDILELHSGPLQDVGSILHIREGSSL